MKTKTYQQLLCFFLGAVLFTSSDFLLTCASHGGKKSQALAVQGNSYPVEVAQASSASYFQTIARADELYQNNQIQEAETLYRQVKPDFPESTPPVVLDPIYEASELDGGGEKLWNNVLDGIERNLESKTFLSLQRLIDNYPEFVPGYLKLAELCDAQPEKCAQYARDGQPTNPIEIVERLAANFPDDPEVIQAKIDILAKYGEKDHEAFLEASIAARQYSLVYVDYPDAPKFKALADEYMKRYQGGLRTSIISQLSLDAIAKIIRGVVNKDLSQGLSALDSIALLIGGESNLGNRAAQANLTQISSEGKLIDNKIIQEYVEGIAGRITPYMGRNFEYEYYIVDDPTLNASAYPGGKIFINTGAILGTDSEAELAGIIGHEIAHAVFSHGYKRVAQSTLLSNLQNTNIPFASFLVELTNKTHSRQNEKQADVVGTRILNELGYAADGLRNFMFTLAQSEGERTTQWNDTHPASVERVRYLERLIVNNGYNRYAYEGVKKHREIQSVILGEEPPQLTEPSTETVSNPSSNSSTSNSSTPLELGVVSKPNTTQVKDGVEIRLEGGLVDSNNSFKVNIAITNRSGRFFALSSLQAKVLDEDGNRISIQVPNISVEAGSTASGQIWVLQRRWNPDGIQNLVLEIKTGSRVFRIPF